MILLFDCPHASLHTVDPQSSAALDHGLSGSTYGNDFERQFDDTSFGAGDNLDSDSRTFR